MKNKIERKNIISNFYKIAEECSVEGLEFLAEDIDATRDAFNTIEEKLSKLDIEQDADSTAFKTKVLGIQAKILDKYTFYGNDETNDEYLLVLAYYILRSEIGSPLLAETQDILEKDDAPFYKENELIVDIVKQIVNNYSSREHLIKHHDDKMIEKKCYATTIDESRGVKAREAAEKKEKEEKKAEEASAEAARTGEEAGRALKEEGRKSREERKERTDEAIRQRELEYERKIKEEEEEKRKLLEDLRTSFTQETIDRELGLIPGSNQEDLEIQEILNQMERTTTDPKDLRKIKELKEDAEEIEGKYNMPQPRYYGGSRPRPSGFFASAIRRKMRLLKK
jgi:hypothetical protein